MTDTATGQDKITAYQIINVGKLEDLTGLVWSALLDNAPESIEDLTADEAHTVLTALALGGGILPSPVPPSSPQSAQTGQTGRCGSCGVDLDHLAAGGYCHDCQ